MCKQWFFFIEQARNLTESDFGKDVCNLDYQTACMMGKVSVVVTFISSLAHPVLMSATLLCSFLPNSWTGRLFRRPVYGLMNSNRRSCPTELLLLTMSNNNRISRLIQCAVSCRFSVQYVKLAWWPSSVDLSTVIRVTLHVLSGCVC